MNWIKLAVLAVALSACGGKKQVETPKVDQSADKVAPGDEAPTPPAQITCEQVVNHVIPIAIEKGMIPADKKDAIIAKGIKKCEDDNPSQDLLKCFLDAASFEEVAKCEAKKGDMSDDAPGEKKDDEKSIKDKNAP